MGKISGLLLKKLSHTINRVVCVIMSFKLLKIPGMDGIFPLLQKVIKVLVPYFVEFLGPVLPMGVFQLPTGILRLPLFLKLGKKIIMRLSHLDL